MYLNESCKELFEKFINKSFYTLYMYNDELHLNYVFHTECEKYKIDYWKLLIQNRVPFILSSSIIDEAYIIRYNDDGFVIINELYDFYRGRFYFNYHKKIILDKKDIMNIKKFWILEKV